MLGGSAGLSELPARYYYDLADTTKNPAYPMTGGKRIRGGMPYFLLPGVDSLSNDVTSQPVMNGPTKFYA